MYLLQNNICSQKKKTHSVIYHFFSFFSPSLSIKTSTMCFVRAFPVTIFDIAIDTRVCHSAYTGVYRGCKLYLEATLTVKKKKAITQGRSLCIFQEKPRRNMKIEKSSTLC